MARSVSFVVFAVLCVSVSCWWEVGHMVVAQIAEKSLNLLGENVALAKFTTLVKAFENLTDGRSNTFV